MHHADTRVHKAKLFGELGYWML